MLLPSDQQAIWIVVVTRTCQRTQWSGFGVVALDTYERSSPSATLFVNDVAESWRGISELQFEEVCYWQICATLQCIPKAIRFLAEQEEQGGISTVKEQQCSELY